MTQFHATPSGRRSLGLKVFFAFALCGSWGCGTARLSSAKEIAKDFDERIVSLESRNKLLEERLRELERAEDKKDEELAELQKRLSNLQPSNAPPLSQAEPTKL